MQTQRQSRARPMLLRSGPPGHATCLSPPSRRIPGPDQATGGGDPVASPQWLAPQPQPRSSALGLHHEHRSHVHLPHGRGGRHVHGPARVAAVVVMPPMRPHAAVMVRVVMAVVVVVRPVRVAVSMMPSVGRAVGVGPMHRPMPMPMPLPTRVVQPVEHMRGRGGAVAMGVRRTPPSDRDGLLLRLALTVALTLAVRGLRLGVRPRGGRRKDPPVRRRRALHPRHRASLRRGVRRR
jgi:hypothetical protein